MDAQFCWLIFIKKTTGIERKVPSVPFGRTGVFQRCSHKKCSEIFVSKMAQKGVVFYAFPKKLEKWNIQNICQVLTKNIFKWSFGIYRNNPSKMDRFSRKSPPETFFTLDAKIKIKCLLLGELRWLFFVKCLWDYALQGHIC